jgi:uncharacterized protein YqjF (DUF2071 family)
MKFDVYANLDHLFMLNFSVKAACLQKLLPSSLKVLDYRGRGFPSIVLPCIKNLRPVGLNFPYVNYELYGLRILVEYKSRQLGRVKGIYFKELIIAPNWVRQIANVVSPFYFKRGTILKRSTVDNVVDISVTNSESEILLSAKVSTDRTSPKRITASSVFSSPEEAMKMYNDIMYGFLPDEKNHMI